jgi:uncharacterized membrane protein HdeD (DUF308 family)
MRREELACLLCGAVLLIAGVAVLFWPAALMVAGVLLIVAGLPRGSA